MGDSGDVRMNKVASRCERDCEGKKIDCTSSQGLKIIS